MAASLGMAVACAELGTGVGEISYIAFDGIPYPAVIAGDTLRDSLGVATPLRASAYDEHGALIVDAPFRYITLDTGVIVVDSTGLLRVTTRRDGLVRVLATVGGLQTDDRSIRVTRRPDSVYAATSDSMRLLYAIPDGATNISPDMRIKLISGDSVGFGPAVGGWLVRWRAVHGSDTLAVTDTAFVSLQTLTAARRAVDTTATDGTSTRKLRVFAARIPTPTDSFVVLAEVRLHGAPVPGSPVRFVVHVAPPAP